MAKLTTTTKSLPNVEAVLYIDPPRATKTRVYEGEYQVILRTTTLCPRPGGGKPVKMSHTICTMYCKSEAEAKSLYDSF